MDVEDALTEEEYTISRTWNVLRLYTLFETKQFASVSFVLIMDAVLGGKDSYYYYYYWMFVDRNFY